MMLPIQFAQIGIALFLGMFSKFCGNMHLNEVLFTNVLKFTKLLLELQIRYIPTSFPLPIIFSSLELSLIENQIVTSPKAVCTN